MPSTVRSAGGALIALALSALGAGTAAVQPARAQDEPAAVLELRFTPAPRAQIAIWVEDANGRFIRTFGLTQAVAFRGIGNRPGASLMNSGYRWPYGRREGALPVWASRRASEPGTRQWKRVIFQNRVEGLASRTAEDQSPDAYFCLSFNQSTTKREALDAVSCASVFTSDKGRFITDADLQQDYSEPWQAPGASTGKMMPLSRDSLYPPRMDLQPCDAGCYDSDDLASFAGHARSVMPEIDEVTMATPPGMVEQSLLFSVPPEWPAGTYSLWIEVGIEGDYNDAYNAQLFPTPTLPESGWDSWAQTYGYAYRGQPSVAYKVSFGHTAPGEASYSTAAPEGRASWDFWSSGYGRLEPLTGMSDVAGSGMDRLLRGDDGQRVHVHVQTLTTPPAPIEGAPDPFGGEPTVPEPEPDPDPGSEASTGGGGSTESDAGIGASAGSGSTGGNGSVEPGDASAEPGSDNAGEPVAPDERVPPADEDDDAVILFEPGKDSSGAVGPIRELRVARHGDHLHAHEWIKLSFLAARSAVALHGYEVRVATEPISDVASFIRNGRPAKTATLAAEGAVSLMLDPKVEAGQPIRAELGDLVAETHYYVAVRATDRLNRRGPISVAQITTPKREFATVTPCFVASAAYGSTLAREVGVLRRVRDRSLLTHAPGRALVHAYYAYGAELASSVREHPWLGSLVRAALRPIVAFAAFARGLESEP